MVANTERFSGRVDNYVRFRPCYPREVMQLLRKRCGLTSQSVVADIGSGPGNLASMFLENGNVVYGVEPNEDMREAAERLLYGYPRFMSQEGCAEKTSLTAHSIDIVVAGQAFHWFLQGAACAEFRRILKPEGHVALVWNDRVSDSSSFMSEYEILLKLFLPGYRKDGHQDPHHHDFKSLFGERYFKHIFPFSQRLNKRQFIGRTLSSSYAPLEGASGHDELVEALSMLFDRYEQFEHVDMVYDTVVVYGQLPRL